MTVKNGAQPNTAPSNLSTGPGEGGGFYNDGSLSVDSSTLTGNSADDGRRGSVFADTAASLTSITNSTVTTNTSNAGEGGALSITSGAITLAGDTIAHNSAESDGGMRLRR